MSREQILRFIYEAAGVSKSRLSLSSTLLGDLGIDGDDASELLERCQDKYKVDFSDSEFVKYFRAEPCYKGLVYIYRKWKYKDEHVASGKTPITVLQLVEACEKGQWCADV